MSLDLDLMPDSRFPSKVYECRFWMMHHGAPSPKRTICYSNMRQVSLLDMGTLTKAFKEERSGAKLTRTLNALSPWITS